jgi:hypothetical protein
MKYLFFLSLLFSAYFADAQTFSAAEKKDFKLREDSLKKLAYNIVNSTDAAVRWRSDSAFTKILVRSLIRDKSFYYPFDSLVSISKLYSPDSSFRIFTWQLVRDDNFLRQKGFIQLKNSNGPEKFIPLRDVSEFIVDKDTIAGNMFWIGAVYYRIIEKEHQGKKYYTLLGYDENNARSTKKCMDVLWFDNNNRPVFGLPAAFSFAKDSVRKPDMNRFFLEYKKDGRARVHYDEEMDMIVYDHLISETNEPNKKYTYIPDGDYEGFQWVNGQWLHIDKVFDFKLKDGEAPVPDALDENKQKINTPAPIKKPVTPVKKKPGGRSK